MTAINGECAPGDDAWGHRDQPPAGAAADVLVVVDAAGRPTAVRWRSLLLPVTQAVRWHERPVIPWWRSQRRLDLDQVLALVDQEHWRLQAEVPPPAATLRAVPARFPTFARSGGDRTRSTGYREGFGGDLGDLGGDLEDGVEDDFHEDFDGDSGEESQDVNDIELERPGPEPAIVIVEVLRAGDDWHVLRVEGP